LRPCPAHLFTNPFTHWEPIIDANKHDQSDSDLYSNAVTNRGPFFTDDGSDAYVGSYWDADANAIHRANIGEDVRALYAILDANTFCYGYPLTNGQADHIPVSR